MVSSSLLGALIGMLLLSKGEALENLLGEDVTLDLIKWDFDSILEIVSKGSDTRKACEENNVEVQPIQKKRAELIRCKDHLTSDSGEFDMDHACNKIEDYTKCVHEGLKSLKNLCHLKGEDKEYVENADKIHMKISKLMCKNDEKKYKDFIKNGKTCVKEKAAELKKCSKDVSTDEMFYEKDDCIEAWDFVECVEDALEDCKAHASDAVVDLMTEGLMATECKGENPTSGGLSAAPVAFFTVLASFIPLVFVF